MDTFYTSANDYLKSIFGKKIFRLSLDAGFTCPNRDGTAGFGGCTFCSAEGSGDFAVHSAVTGELLKEQVNLAKRQVAGKLPKNGAPYGYAAYFQAFTNTYAPIDILRKLYTETAQMPEIEALFIATRPDCLPDEVIELLSEINRIKPVYVELGFQTMHQHSIEYINRCYGNEVFETAVLELSKRNLPVIVHCILGLPHETPEDMEKTVDYVCTLPIHGIKLQLLHVLKGTRLAADYERFLSEQAFYCMEEEQYLEVLMRLLPHIPKRVVIYRLTGDGPKKLLIAPLWSANKKHVLNHLTQKLKQHQIKQGEMLCQRKP